jgi:predicted PurR-regulated permease PerM
MVLVPKFMGKVTGLKPAVILMSLSVWGSLMGMVGLIIALPLTTLIISYYKRFVLNEEGLPVEQQATASDTVVGEAETDV